MKLINATELFEDINTGCIVEVTQAANSYFDRERGLTVRQQFFLYPDGDVIGLNYVDGGYSTIYLDEDDQATFDHIYLRP